VVQALDFKAETAELIRVEEPVAEVILVHGEDKRAAVMLLFVIR
jgi:hypothetical protein